MRPFGRKPLIAMIAIATVSITALGASVIPARAQTESVLYSFCSQPGCADGETPLAGLIQGSDGNFYGTTYYGGVNGKGTVFKITPAGVLTTLYSFCSQTNCTDGANPLGLIEGSDGNFYGTAQAGGRNDNGTVFKLAPTGVLTTLYSFCSRGGGNCTDGADPASNLIEGRDGNFYGITGFGGGGYAQGTVFKLTPAGKLTTLHSFCKRKSCTDGESPVGLIEGGDGNFFGTTAYVGRNGAGGTVFKISTSGALKTLYSFCRRTNCTDGASPYAGLTRGSHGNFYGTTFFGGLNDNIIDGGGGTVFKITATGSLTTLYSFCGQPNCTDGDAPQASLIQGSDANFYGVTFGGGENYGVDSGVGGGTVFKITPAGTLTSIYSFCSQGNCTDGAGPAGLIEGSDGNFYGTTSGGGANIAADDGYGAGTVFKLTLPAPVSGTLTVAPQKHSFGNKTIGTTTLKTFEVKATAAKKSGGSPVLLENFSVNSSIGAYALDTATTTCTQGEALTPNESCVIGVDFTPVSVTGGLAERGTITVTTNAEKVKPANGVVQLTGRGKFPR